MALQVPEELKGAICNIDGEYSLVKTPLYSDGELELLPSDSLTCALKGDLLLFMVPCALRLQGLHTAGSCSVAIEQCAHSTDANYFSQLCQWYISFADALPACLSLQRSMYNRSAPAASHK